MNREKKDTAVEWNRFNITEFKRTSQASIRDQKKESPNPSKEEREANSCDLPN